MDDVGKWVMDDNDVSVFSMARWDSSENSSIVHHLAFQLLSSSALVLMALDSAYLLYSS
jgi:hypothetical protein